MGKTKQEFLDYDGFVEKFKPKRTTDDCMTPPEVYEAVADYASRRFGVAHGSMVRPFWPGGDYAAFEYSERCVVVDNPPFSILARIVDDYVAWGVPFLLFAPSLTCLGLMSRHLGKVHVLACAANVVYENGALVRTSFLTSFCPEVAAESCPELSCLVCEASDRAEERRRSEACKPKAAMPRYEYPPEVLTAAKLVWMADKGQAFSVDAGDCAFVRTLDDMKAAGKSGIFGGGLLLSERAAAERAAAERREVHRWELSERERAVQAMLG